jgi:hypothetical protein
VAEDRLNEDTESIAAAFLFRHYLELSLKNIILAGRFLTKEGHNAPRENAVPAWGHNLSELWKLVLSDAKPKMEADWGNHDIEFAEKCIAEFDAIDPKGMAFRYTGEGAASLSVHFGWLARNRMRQFVASLVIAVMAWSFVGPAALAATGWDAPACCRRNGKHHCMSGTSAVSTEGLASLCRTSWILVSSECRVNGFSSNKVSSSRMP